MYKLGIDLGATYTHVRYSKTEYGSQLETSSFEFRDNKRIPSSILLQGEKITIGKAALETKRQKNYLLSESCKLDLVNAVEKNEIKFEAELCGYFLQALLYSDSCSFNIRIGEIEEICIALPPRIIKSIQYEKIKLDIEKPIRKATQCRSDIKISYIGEVEAAWLACTIGYRMMFTTSNILLVDGGGSTINLSNFRYTDDSVYVAQNVKTLNSGKSGEHLLHCIATKNNIKPYEKTALRAQMYKDTINDDEALELYEGALSENCTEETLNLVTWCLYQDTDNQKDITLGSIISETRKVISPIKEELQNRVTKDTSVVLVGGFFKFAASYLIIKDILSTIDSRLKIKTLPNTENVDSITAYGAYLRIATPNEIKELPFSTIAIYARDEFETGYLEVLNYDKLQYNEESTLTFSNKLTIFNYEFQLKLILEDSNKGKREIILPIKIDTTKISLPITCKKILLTLRSNNDFTLELNTGSETIASTTGKM